LNAARAHLEDVPWDDGRMTAGYVSHKAKANLQLPEDHEAARGVREIILAALDRNGLFRSAALPRHIFPPLINRYEAGMTYGDHVDNAIRQTRAGQRIRTDVSATVFLSRPEEYDGGELVIRDTFGSHSVKMAAGDMVLYPATSLHRVAPVTRGVRIAAFFWVQSLVKDDTDRSILFDLDRTVVELAQTAPDNPAILKLTACYHNLIRRWAEA